MGSSLLETVARFGMGLITWATVAKLVAAA
jgi:hypothetical protein